MSAWDDGYGELTAEQRAVLDALPPDEQIAAMEEWRRYCADVKEFQESLVVAAEAADKAIDSVLVAVPPRQRDLIVDHLFTMALFAQKMRDFGRSDLSGAED